MLLYALLLCLPLALSEAAECSKDRECPKDQACIDQSCDDPCKDGCGEANTICKVTNHRPFCFYLPERELQEERISVNIVRKYAHGQLVSSDTQTSSDHSPDLKRILALTQSAADGCTKDEECPTNQACINDKCQDPCKESCGGFNTVCNVTNHRPFCHSLAPYGEDINTKCRGNSTTQCKTTSTSGYNYNQFFQLPGTKDKGNAGQFMLRFKVKTFTDAHVLLSRRPFPSGNEPVIEIVIGGWGNSQSVIRASKQGEPIPGSTIQTKNILSNTETRGFWVKRNQGKLLTLGKEGSTQPFMQGTDPHSTNYQYFSFSSWGGATGSWQYDCTDTDTVCKTPD